MARNNPNLNKIIDFDEVLRRVRVSEIEFDETHGYWSDETFVARDRSNEIATVSRDGDTTVHLDTGIAYLHHVPMDAIAAVLGEHGFDYKNAAWHQDQSQIKENDEPGYIYVIQMQGTTLYKIGRTKEYKNRVSLLGVLMPKPAEFIGVWRVPNMRTVEAGIHMDLAVFHSNGEWFDLLDTSKLLMYLNDVYKRIQ